jgi:hypothetical protein
METHGTESYFILGEALPDETVGGRQSTPALAPEVEAVAPPLRFSRLGPKPLRWT